MYEWVKVDKFPDDIITEYELALRGEKGRVLLVYLHLLEGLYELAVLGQHELSLQPRVNQSKHVCS